MEVHNNYAIHAICASDERTRIRPRKRTINAHARAMELARCAVSWRGEPHISCFHGGSVCNSYGYPAVTDCVLVCTMHRPMSEAERFADLDGAIWSVWWAAEAPANKITYGGAAERCLRGSRYMFDRRAPVGSELENLAREVIVREAVSAIEAVLREAHEHELRAFAEFAAC